MHALALGLPDLSLSCQKLRFGFLSGLMPKSIQERLDPWLMALEIIV